MTKRWTSMRRYLKPVLLLAGAGGAFAWDLSQADSHLAQTYRSFLPEAESRAHAMAPATVAVVRSNDPALGADTCDVRSESIGSATIDKMVRRAVGLAGGLQALVKSGDTVLIKPNLVQQDSSGSGGITDVRVVRALVFLVDEIDHGRIKIIVGDGSPRPFTSFEKASGTTQKSWTGLFDVSGYQSLRAEAQAAGIDFRLSNLNGNSDDSPWPELDTASVPGGGQAHLQGGRYFVHRDVTKASVYITVPVMKVHKDVRFTGALKNQIGLAAGTRYGFNKLSGVVQDGRAHKLHHTSLMSSTWHNWQDKEIVDLAAIARIRLCVVDAITCLDSVKSPNYLRSDSSNLRISNRIKMNTIIAGSDPVAVDNVCCRIMGINPDDIDHITLAERVGLGTNDPARISVAGTAIEQIRRPFRYAQPVSTTNTSSFGQSNRTWLLSACFSAAGIGDPLQHPFIAEEAAAAPQAGAEGWSQAVYFTDDQILLNDYYGAQASPPSVSYAFSYFDAPASQEAELWVGSDEGLKVYLNGTVVYQYAGTRTFAGNEFYKEIVPMHVQQGRNRLLVKAYQSTGKYSFSLNICESQSDPLYKGNRIAGLRFTTVGTGSSVLRLDGPEPSAFQVTDCFPNPFNAATSIRFTLPFRSAVRLAVYDLTGREVACLADEVIDAGTWMRRWEAGAASGMYVCRLEAAAVAHPGKRFVDARKVILLR